MGWGDRLIYAALGGVFGALIGVGLGLVVGLLIRDPSVGMGSVLAHWALWSVVLLAVLGWVRGVRAADTLADIFTALAFLYAGAMSLMTLAPIVDSYRGARGRVALWPWVWVCAGLGAILLTQPGL